jgi:predicted DNA-binding protein (MmcQ/YjbR family)
VTLDAFCEFCLTREGAKEEFPFGENILVFKVKGKMFALTDVETFESINLKCDPENALDLRERYPSVLPGYHMNKKHWNTVLMDGSIPDKLIKQWIEESYALVAPKKATPPRKRN